MTRTEAGAGPPRKLEVRFRPVWEESPTEAGDPLLRCGDLALRGRTVISRRRPLYYLSNRGVRRPVLWPPYFHQTRACSWLRPEGGATHMDAVLQVLLKNLTKGAR